MNIWYKKVSIKYKDYIRIGSKVQTNYTNNNGQNSFTIKSIYLLQSQILTSFHMVFFSINMAHFSMIRGKIQFSLKHYEHSNLFSYFLGIKCVEVYSGYLQ